MVELEMLNISSQWFGEVKLIVWLYTFRKNDNLENPFAF